MVGKMLSMMPNFLVVENYYFEEDSAVMHEYSSYIHIIELYFPTKPKLGKLLF